MAVCFKPASTTGRISHYELARSLAIQGWLKMTAFYLIVLSRIIAELSIIKWRVPCIEN